jgi:hypothetical protein
MGLNSLKTFGLADVRAVARECRQQVANGENPIKVRDSKNVSKQKAAATNSRTFEVCAREYRGTHH